MTENKVYHLNFLENTLPDNCANLIIADPPYFEVKGEFDFIWKSFEDYLKDVEKWAIECKRILKENGTLLWFGDAKKIAYSQIIFDKYFDLLNSIVWENTNPHKQQIRFNKGLRSFAPITERILMYSNETYNLTKCVFLIRDYIRQEIIKSKGKINNYDINSVLGTATNGGGVASACLSLKKAEPAMITEEMYLKLQKWCEPFLSKRYEELRLEYEELRLEYEELRRPFDNFDNFGDVIRLPNYETKKFNHDTIKPEELQRKLILTTTKKNDLVVVPFAGSGTECAMALKEKRNFIGFEIEEKHVNTSNKRIELIKSKPQLF